jgi:hypothetical protein
MKANGGAIPNAPTQLQAFLKPNVRRTQKVTANQLLSHALFIPVKDAKDPNFTLAPWRIAIVVHVLGNGPMNFDRTIVATDDEYKHVDLVGDDQFISMFGVEWLKKAKTNPFQLP